MEILFIVDSIKDIDKKIALLEPLGADIKFFVDAKNVAKLTRKKRVVAHISAIYNNNINATIDKYLKDENYKPCATVIYYSSAELTVEIVNQIRQQLQLNPDTIYVKKKLSLWNRFKMWFYHKVIRFIFGANDAYASVKLQYFSADLMEAFVATSFKNHIFNINNSVSIELSKDKEKSYYNKVKFNKNYLYNPIAFCLILICYVVMEKFLNLPFWLYFFGYSIVIGNNY